MARLARVEVQRLTVVRDRHGGTSCGGSGIRSCSARVKHLQAGKPQESMQQHCDGLLLDAGKGSLLLPRRRRVSLAAERRRRPGTDRCPTSQLKGACSDTSMDSGQGTEEGTVTSTAMARLARVVSATAHCCEGQARRDLLRRLRYSLMLCKGETPPGGQTAGVCSLPC